VGNGILARGSRGQDWDRGMARMDDKDGQRDGDSGMNAKLDYRTREARPRKRGANDRPSRLRCAGRVEGMVRGVQCSAAQDARR
jgi:hypothetical protein